MILHSVTMYPRANLILANLEDFFFLFFIINTFCIVCWEMFYKKTTKSLLFRNSITIPKFEHIIHTDNI